MSLDIRFYLETGGDPEGIKVFETNITHNVGVMAREAGIYKSIWRPDEMGVKCAGEIVETIEGGLERMKANPEKFKLLQHSSWGTYDQFVEWVEEYLNKCKAIPKARIDVNR